ncbi:unnamed protein product [Nezara viridula]|uniref:Neuropeptide n=1 Tax=Nezara viridula TaxID=85310 RepID=A0A9P0EA99_NEZVI|nr:unnamed protein product [Nezara viridula]
MWLLCLCALVALVGSSAGQSCTMPAAQVSHSELCTPARMDCCLYPLVGCLSVGGFNMCVLNITALPGYILNTGGAIG